MLHELSHVVDCLRSSDVFNLQGVNSTMKELIDETQSWRAIIKRELPNFKVSNGLWNDSRCRSMIVKCFGVLARGVISRESVIRATNANELEQLERCLSKAEKTRTSHFAKGGRAACTLVGHFDLSCDCQASSFAFNASRAAILGGLPAGDLIIKMCVNAEGSVVLGAKYRPLGRRQSPAVEAGTSTFTANLMSVDSGTNVSFREGLLRIDGTLREVLHSSLRRGKGQPQSPSLCVLCLTDGSPRGPSQLAAALNMDTRRKR
eukprot:TRINITY_DN4771_c0_g1_i11.p1 TRINITY_DN4771_c0_g1~~TRINITY_DN4771_c0_g1_i11.p1  ORF type:complete len:262 (-),score=38.00 TRINITY_DN4771_c0_g1_i11:490-1275(-)